MKTTSNSIQATNKNIPRVFLLTGLLLLIPLIAMQFTSEVNWSTEDFVAAAILLLCAGLTYELLVKRISNFNYRVVVAIVLVMAFLYVWAELAIGIFTNWGS